VGITPQQFEEWYTSDKGRFVDLLEKETIKTLCKINHGDKVLEIGCGTGHFSAYFESLGAEVVGLDTSPEMLKFAKDRNGKLNIDFQAGDAYRLPFPDNSFDLVAMITVLEFISNPGQAIKEAFRVSRNKIFLGILNRFSLLAWKRRRSKKDIWGKAHFYSLKEILGFLGKNKKVRWRSVVFFPLINSRIFFNLRLALEKLFSRLNFQFGAFTGILIYK
jgi:ubiquinone/menaquinone biosynthesis C-methylase UbiE